MDWPSALFDLDLIKVNAIPKVFLFLGLFLNNTIKKDVDPDPGLVFKLGFTLFLEINYRFLVISIKMLFYSWTSKQRIALFVSWP